MHLLTLLAQTAAPATTAPIAPPWVQFLNSGIMPIILVLIVFMLFTSGGKRKTEAARKALLDNLKKGDLVKLIGGEYGTVVDVRGTKVLIKVDESSNTKILYAREAIVAVETESAAKEDTK